MRVLSRIVFGLFWSCLMTPGTPFSALPYVHIDFGHFFRLAQCQAKCTEKYGQVASRTLLDGSQRRFFNVSNDGCLACERGCSHGRLPTRRHTASALETAYSDGQGFWRQSQTDDGGGDQGPLEAVEVLCVRPSGESVDGFGDSLTAKVAGRLKTDFVAPVRFIVQWKQLVLLGPGRRTETKWITGSIEQRPVVEVEQLQPGLFYQFQLTVVGPNGRLGKGVLSDWFQAPGEAVLQPDSALVVRPRYNGDDGLSVLLDWPSLPTRTPRRSSDTGLQLAGPPTGCRFHVVLDGAPTSGTVDLVVEKDESEGLLLTALEYSTEYRVRVESDDGWRGEHRFRSLSCSEVHGKGSLECDPEAVEGLTVTLHDNSTALVSWNHAVDPANVLTYQLVYSSLEGTGDCQPFQNSVYLNATKTRTTVLLPPGAECDVEVQVIAFDPFGREAVASRRFHLAPSTRPLPTLWVVLGPGTGFLLLWGLLHCAGCCQRSRKKVGGLTVDKQPPENV